MKPTSATPARRASPRDWAALGVLTLAVVLLAIDGTVLSLAVPALTADLQASATDILWIGDIYSFMLAGLLITMGNLADRIGRKRLLLMGATGFGLASALSAFSASPEMLIVARALLGVSGATLMPSTLSIVRAIFEDPTQRTRAIAVWTAGATGGAAAGPLVGGALLEHFHWGAVFLINVPVVVVILIAGWFLLPESRDPGRPRIDVLSSVLSILAIVPLVYAVKRTMAHGFDWTAVAGVLVGVVAGLLFARRQRNLRTPFIDIALFRIPAFSGAVAANTLAIFAFSGLLFFFSQYLQLVRGFGPLQAGIAELPATIATLVVILVVGAVVRRLGPGRAIGAGLGVGALGLAWLAVAEGLDSYLWIAIALGVVGLGVGVAATLSTDAVVTAVPKARAGAAASISETGYELGVALGIAVLGALQALLYRAFLDVPQGTEAGLAASVEESLAAAAFALDPSVDGHAQLLELSRHAFTSGMQITSLIAAAILLVAAMVAWRVIPSTRAEQVER
jgi:DHA2 family multidrug resistance protein-like MFS transporter